MNFVYNTAIRLYSFGAKVFALKDKKANLMISGQKKTMEILRNEIDPNDKYVWIHVSSLGEFEQGRPLIEMIKRENQNQKILLTFFSPSGYEVCKNYQLADTICYLPFDTPSKVKKFLDAVNIDKAIFVKYEFWGNYLSQLKNISKNDLTYEPLYEGKKALIGDYFSPSYNNTKKVLEINKKDKYVYFSKNIKCPINSYFNI